MAKSLRIAMLISGNGTTAAAIIDACRSGALKGIEPVCVIASNADASGIAKANDRDIPTFVRSPKDFRDAEAFGESILEICEQFDIDLIGQYGWMCLTPANVIRVYDDKMINQHPGPLDPGRPDFGGKSMYGKRVHCARLLFVQKTNHDWWTEATAQRVAEEFDRGAVIKKQQLKILPNDTVESLTERLLPIEHEIQIQALQDFANGTVQEIIRPKPLVHPGEIEILEEVKSQLNNCTLMDKTLLKILVIAALFAGEAATIYAEIAAAKYYSIDGLSFYGVFLKILPIFLIGAALLVAGYMWGLAVFKNIWIVGAISITSILVVEPVLAYAVTQHIPTKGAVIGLIFGTLGFIAALFL